MAGPHRQPQTAPDLLTSQQVAERLSISVRTLYRMVKHGQAPRPVRLRSRMLRWRRSDVEKYLRRLEDLAE